MKPVFDIRTVMVELTDTARLGMSTKRFNDYLINLQDSVPAYSPIIIPGSGTGNDTAAIQTGISSAASKGGSVVVLPPGVFSIDTVAFPVGTAPITLIGQGDSTIIRRRSTIADGKGVFDVLGQNVSIESLVIDGQVTSPTGLLYNGGFSTTTSANDPMAVSLTKNTSIWVHGGANNFSCYRVKIQNTGGYAALIDAGSGAGINDVKFIDCQFVNNRPNLFGVVAGAEVYGSWSGGIYVNGDGRAANPGCVLRRFTVSQCQFLRGTGNQIWSHLYGLDELHEDFQILSNYFLDIGLDGVLVGGVTGGAVIGNTFRRIGYTTQTDTDRSVPQWLPNLNATAIDSSGLVKAVVYANNSMLSVNGGAIDLDGHGLSAINGNAARIPYPDEPEYEEDQIGNSGVGNAGNTSYGINIGNTSNTPYGAADLEITGNSLINLRAGAARLFGTRRCMFAGNLVIASTANIYPPIGMGPLGPGPNQRCTDNKVCHNKIDYSPVSAAPAIFEDPSISPFVASDANSVFGNTPITGNGLATEFQPDASSSSVHYAETVWFP